MYQYQTDFINTVKPLIIADMRRTGILASLTAAQAIFESGWGRSELAKKANNLFGMKGNYKGESYTVVTGEYVGGAYQTVPAAFRKYPSWEVSIYDHSEKFLTMQRYANLRGCTDYKLACKRVQEDGYATAPEYADKLIKAIETYRLYEWDKETGGATMVKSAFATSSVDFGAKKSNPRTQKITKITPHIMDVITTDPVRVAKSHYSGTVESSANYYIAGGKICSGVSEDRRAWTSSSKANDQQAITIEVANCEGKPDYPVSTADYQALIALCADVCKRYGITPHYDGTPNGSITVHRMFAKKACPGEYLMRLIESGQFERDILAAMGRAAPSAGKLYRVQVGAFKSLPNADKFAGTMREIGERTIIVQDGGMYKVQVGAYSSKANAERHVERLKAGGYSAFII